MSAYQYTGPVLFFERVINPHWTAVTNAPTEAKAKSNLSYRFKCENNLAPNTKILLPGKLTSMCEEVK